MGGQLHQSPGTSKDQRLSVSPLHLRWCSLTWVIFFLSFGGWKPPEKFDLRSFLGQPYDIVFVRFFFPDHFRDNGSKCGPRYFYFFVCPPPTENCGCTKESAITCAAINYATSSRPWHPFDLRTIVHRSSYVHKCDSNRRRDFLFMTNDCSEKKTRRGKKLVMI